MNNQRVCREYNSIFRNKYGFSPEQCEEKDNNKTLRKKEKVKMLDEVNLCVVCKKKTFEGIQNSCCYRWVRKCNTRQYLIKCVSKIKLSCGASMLGVKARRDIEKGYVFGEYVGVHMTYPLSEEQYAIVKTSDKSFDITGYTQRKKVYSSAYVKIITPTKKISCLLSFVNTHKQKEKHNVISQQINGNIYFIAKRKIKKGEELYIHYSDYFYTVLFGNGDA